MASVNLGPLSFSVPLFLAAITLVVMLVAGWLVDRRHGTWSKPLCGKRLLLACLWVGPSLYCSIFHQQRPLHARPEGRRFAGWAGLAAG